MTDPYEKRRRQEADEIDAEKQGAYDRIAAYRAKVIEQTGDDWIELTVEDGRVLRCPRLPFLHWALGFKGRHLLDKWEWVTPPSFKMTNDDPFHTDWMLGAGLDILSWHGHRRFGIEVDQALIDAAYEKQWVLQCEMLKFQCAVLSGSGSVEGYVMHAKPNKGLELQLGQPDANGRCIRNSWHEGVRVIVIPHAGPEYVQAAMEIQRMGGAVITERGGAMAHLVNIGREQNLKIVRAKDAMNRFPDHMLKVTVDCDRGSITIHT